VKKILKSAHVQVEFHVRLSAAVYRTDLDNDIQFISGGAAATNAGYFATLDRRVARASN
jgi:hypothetical protein